MQLEKIALNDDYFIERKLYPNVDFYSGIIYRALGIPTNLFTVLFAVARTAGWVAQWKEMIEDPAMKIGRPRQLYIGEGPRKFVPLGKTEVASSGPDRLTGSCTCTRMRTWHGTISSPTRKPAIT